MDQIFRTVLVPLGNALAADTITKGALDNIERDYPWINGVWMKEVVPSGGNTFLYGGLEDSKSGDVLELAPVEVYYGDTSVKPEDKFTKILIANDGRIIKPKVRNAVLTTNALGLVVFVFRCVKNLEVQ
jgi:hypothetical protein